MLVGRWRLAKGERRGRKLIPDSKWSADYQVSEGGGRGRGGRIMASIINEGAGQGRGWRWS